jgi:hypothetical protein
MFDSLNHKLIGLSIILLVCGYVLLGQGPITSICSWSLAPLILIGVYVLLIPFAILAKEKSDKKK